MSHPQKPWSLLRRIVPQRPAERVPDPADMGTAFGLDFCLSQREAEDGVTGTDLIEGPDKLFQRLFSAPAVRR